MTAALTLCCCGYLYGGLAERKLFTESAAPAAPGVTAPAGLKQNRQKDSRELASATALLASEQLIVLKAGADALTVDDFFSGTDGGRTQRTIARLAYDRDGLTVAFDCFEENMSALKADGQVHDQNLSGDDTVEVRIDISGSGRNWFQVACNSLGVVRDERVLSPRIRDTGWNLSRKAVVKRLKDRWTVKVVIPFSDLGIPDDPINSVVQVSFARRRYAGSPLEHSAWSRLSDGFRPVLLSGEQTVQTLSCISVSRGALTREGTIWNDNRFKALVRNRTGGKQVFHGKAIARDAAEVLSTDAATLELAPGAEGVVNLSYQVAGRPGEVVDFTITAEGDSKAVYKARWPVMFEVFPHTSGAADPLYEELMSGKPMSEFGASAFLWQHPLYYYYMRPVAKRMGLAYSPVQVMTEMQRNGVMLLTGPIAFTDYREIKPGCIQTGLKICYYPIDFPDSKRYILTDKGIEGYLQQVADVIDQHGEVLWGIFAGDEQDKLAIRQPLHAGGKLEISRHEVNHPIYTKVDSEVREQFGFGKFGAPITQEDNDPFRRIAYFRYTNARMRQRHQKLRELVKQKAPELVLVSTDPVSGMHPYEFSLQRDLFDIFTHQTSPRANNGPVITKLLADLTGKDVWPCAHIEGSRNTVEDVRLKCSRLIASGATGLHGYFAHFYGVPPRPELVSPYFSSPPRYNAFLRVCHMMQSMRKIAFPEQTALAVFYSNYSNMADPGSLVYPGQNANAHGWEIHRTYGLLVRAKHWFRFTDEHTLDQTIGSGLKVLYLPKGAYQDRNTFERMRRFVEKGGTLVCADPTVFSYDIDGTETSDRRRTLFGTTLQSSEEIRQARIQIDIPEFFGAFKKGDTLDLTAGTSRKPFTIHEIVPEKTAAVLARFEDGKPAIITQSVGKGRTFYFAFNPFGSVYHGSDRAKWPSLFKSLNEGLGIAPDCPIWRFELPAEKFADLMSKRPSGMCLSNNYMYWDMEQPVEVKNVNTGGSYTYSLSPDCMNDVGMGDTGDDEPGDDMLSFISDAIPFSKGDLTDRHRSYRNVFPRRANSSYSNYDGIQVGNWAAAWKDPSPFDITFDLKKSFPVHRLRLFFSGQLPEIILFYENESGKWIRCASKDSLDAGEDVLVVDLEPAATRTCRRLKLRFGARTPSRTLILTEVEIWSESE